MKILQVPTKELAEKYAGQLDAQDIRCWILEREEYRAWEVHAEIPTDAVVFHELGQIWSTHSRGGITIIRKVNEGRCEFDLEVEIRKPDPEYF